MWVSQQKMFVNEWMNTTEVSLVPLCLTYHGLLRPSLLFAIVKGLKRLKNISRMVQGMLSQRDICGRHPLYSFAAQRSLVCEAREADPPPQPSCYASFAGCNRNVTQSVIEGSGSRLTIPQRHSITSNFPTMELFTENVMRNEMPTLETCSNPSSASSTLYPRSTYAF